MICIIDYGSGNVHAIANIYYKLGIEHKISSTISDVETASKLILPGVGAFDEVMNELIASGLIPTLNKRVLQDKIPILGICVGMQIFANSSDEGNVNGLSWVDASVKKMKVESLKNKPYLPHMGWNTAELKIDHKLTENIDIEKGFYFLHSYYFECNNQQNILMTTTYGDNFCSAVVNENIFGTQFHPEKSHINGITIFKNFATL